MPPRRSRRRHEPLPRCRRPRPVGRSKGRSTRQALAALAADEATTSVIVVSKPPAAEVLADVQAYAAGLGRAGPLGDARAQAGPTSPPPSRRALRADGHTVPEWPCVDQRTRSRCRSGRCAVCSAAAPSPTRRCSSRARRSAGIRSNIPLSDGPRPRRRPARRQPRRHRLRRRHDDPGPGAPDDRPARCGSSGSPRRRATRRAACCCSTSSSATARTRTPPTSSPRPSATPAPRRRGTDGPCPWWSRSPASRTTPRAWTAARPRCSGAGASVFLSNAQATRHALSLLPATAQEN